MKKASGVAVVSTPRKALRPPRSVRTTLWSYDWSAIDFQRDRELIITQVLNYGDWAAVTWLVDTFGEPAIAEIIRNPRRGMWWPRVLNYWIVRLGVKVPARLRRRAVIRLDSVRPDITP